MLLASMIQVGKLRIPCAGALNAPLFLLRSELGNIENFIFKKEFFVRILSIKIFSLRIFILFLYNKS